MQLFSFLFPLQHMKRPALQNKQVVLLRMAFRARKVLGTFEKQGPHQQRDKELLCFQRCLKILKQCFPIVTGRLVRTR